MNEGIFLRKNVINIEKKDTSEAVKKKAVGDDAYSDLK